MKPLLAHRVDGRGEPLLLLNGGMMTIASWAGFAEALAREFRVIRCDLRGQLLSPGAPPEQLEEHVPDVLALLTELRALPAHVLGTSYGGEVALYLAARHPEAVGSLVAVTAVDRFPQETLEGAALEARVCREAAAGGDRGRLYDLMIETTFSPGWARQHRTALAERRVQVAALPTEWFASLAVLLESLATVDLTPELLGAIRCPALVVAADGDRLMPVPRVRAVARGIRGARFELVEGSGHALLLERPEALLPLCREFFAARTAGAAR